MADHLSPYLHRANRDGTFDSICIRCFVTVGYCSHRIQSGWT
jgi:hypothetical protein